MDLECVLVEGKLGGQAALCKMLHKEAMQHSDEKYRFEASLLGFNSPSSAIY